MKTPSPTKSMRNSGSPHGSVSPDRRKVIKPTLFAGPPATPRAQPEHKLKVLGHSMISRSSGDAESEMSGLNVDLRLITSRMAQTLRTYEGKHNSAVRAQIEDVEEHLTEISNPVLQLQVKMVLEDYREMAEERENILANLEDWFANCSDEFLEELLEFESQFEGDDTLSEHLMHAKDVIAKIKFINKKILEFQNNGMSTKKLIAQKKTLEKELLKKKVIVDNTSKGSEAYTTWKQNVANLFTLIKDSSANEIDKAILDLKLSEATDHVSEHLIALERTSRRIGVLFKNVKELETSNSMLAEENSYLKCRLAKIDKHFKDVMDKKVKKLDDTLSDIKEVKHLQTNESGLNPDAINLSLKNGGVMSLEMEMIDNYQQSIHTLDSENRTLLSKVEKYEEEIELQKEEIVTLNQKLKIDGLGKSATSPVNQASISHPLVKLESNSEVQETNAMKLYQTNMIKRNTAHRLNDRRHSSVVSSITIQDGSLIDNLRAENENLREKLHKVKNSLTNLRKQQSHHAKTLNKKTQADVFRNETLASESDLPIHLNQSQSDSNTSEIEDQSIKKKIKKRRTIKSRLQQKRGKSESKDSKEANIDGVVLESEIKSDGNDSSIEEDVDIQFLNEGSREDTSSRISHATEDLQKYLQQNEDDKQAKKLKMKLKELARTSEVKIKKSNILEKSTKFADCTVSELNTSDNNQKEEDHSSSEKMSLTNENEKPIQKQKHQQKVKFDEDVLKKETEILHKPEPPEFQRMPTPKVDEEEDPVFMINKIKQEIKEFLIYGDKFIGDIHKCIIEMTDDDLAVNIDYYADMEQKIQGLETSMNILLYGIDLGMSVSAPTTQRPTYSPLPFENKLYFQENLSKYLRAKYPKLNVNAMRLFDPDLDPTKQRTMNEVHVQPPGSPDSRTYRPFSEYTEHCMFTNNLKTHTNTPEPPRIRKIPNKIHKGKQFRKSDSIGLGKIEEIMNSLTSVRALKGDHTAHNRAIDERSFAEIVDRVMPKEVAMEYMKLVQPTHDTFGKRQYNEKLKRGVSKVKDLLDLVNMNPIPAVIKGLPTNKLGEPRARQTKLHHNNMELSATGLVKTRPSLAQLPASDTTVQYDFHNNQYRHRIVTNDERVRASLDDYDETSMLSTSNSLTVLEVPITVRAPPDSKKLDDKSTFKEDMFDLSKSSPRIDKTVASDKRSFLPMVRQNLLPHSEAKSFPSRSKKLKKTVNQPHPVMDGTSPKVSDILNLGWSKAVSKMGSSSIEKLPNINRSRVTENSSFP